LIDENNEQIGVVELDDARQRAREASLDLVEVAPQSSPPVCRIMDYGKWKYQQKKKEQKARSHAAKSELKGMRLRPKIDDHDLKIKVNRAKQFLEASNKVQFTMIFRGREMAHRNLGLRTMKNICEELADISKVETPPRMMHRRMTMVLAPDHTGKQNKTDKTNKTQPAKEATPQPSTPSAG